MKKVLMYSGGLDSWLIDKLWKPDVKVYVNIHGAYNAEEIKRLPPDVVVVDFPFLADKELPNKFVPLRNLYFLMIGSHYGDLVCLGATAGDWGNKDKTPEFLKDADRMLNYLWGDKKIAQDVHVEQGFVHVSKAELIERYLAQGGTIDEIRNATFSCYTPQDGHECMACYPCFRKFALLYAFGCQYDYPTRLKMWNYVKNNIIPTKEEGGYQGTYYTDRGEESKYLIKAVELLKAEFGDGNK